MWVTLQKRIFTSDYFDNNTQIITIRAPTSSLKKMLPSGDTVLFALNKTFAAFKNSRFVLCSLTSFIICNNLTWSLPKLMYNTCKLSEAINSGDFFFTAKGGLNKKTVFQ